MLPRALLHSARATCSRPAVTIVSRPFTVSSRRLASGVQDDFMGDPAFQAFFEKVGKHKGALDAMNKMGELVKSKGIDTSRQPTTMEMLKLATDKDLQAAAKNMVDELKAAGVEFNPQTMMEMMKKMGKGE